MSASIQRAVVSFGGGVQSTTLAWLVIKRDPRLAKIVTTWPTLFVFADTGDEPAEVYDCLLYTSPSPRDVEESRMPSSA